MRTAVGKSRPLIFSLLASGLLSGCNFHASHDIGHRHMSIKDGPAESVRAFPLIKTSAREPVPSPERARMPVPKRIAAVSKTEPLPAPPKTARNEPPVYIGTPSGERRIETPPAAVPPPALIRPAGEPKAVEQKPIMQSSPPAVIARPAQRVTEQPVTPPVVAAPAPAVQAAPPAAPAQKSVNVVVPPLPFVVPLPPPPPAAPKAAAAPVQITVVAAAPPSAPALAPVAAPSQQPVLVMPPPVVAPAAPQAALVVPKAPERPAAAPIEPVRKAARLSEPPVQLPAQLPVQPKAATPAASVAEPKAEPKPAAKVETKSEQQIASAASIIKQVPAPQPQSKTIALPPKNAPEELIDRASLLLSVGNVASARDLLNEAARGGNTNALVELGGSYDPVALNKFVAVPAAAADPQRAMGYYEQAAAKGSDVAKARIEALKAHVAKAK